MYGWLFIQGGIPGALVTPPLGGSGALGGAGAQQRRTALATAGQRLLAAQAGAVNQASTTKLRGRPCIYTNVYYFYFAEVPCTILLSVF